MIKNFTPHTIRIRVSDSAAPEPDPTDIVIESVGCARVGTRSTPVATLDGVPVVCVEYTEVTGLPAPVDGTLYAVSLLVMQALPGRLDLIGPATGPDDGAIRDVDGRIYAVRKWQAVAPWQTTKETR